jgi:hypothetical protein
MTPRRSCWTRVTHSILSSSAPASLPNRKASSLASSVRIGTSSHGLQKTCQVCRGSWLSTHFISGQMPSRSSNRCCTLQKRRERPLVRRDRPAPRSRLHHGSVLPRLVGELKSGTEEEQYLAHVYRIHQPQQGLPQGPLRTTAHRSGDRFHSRL